MPCTLSTYHWLVLAPACLVIGSGAVAQAQVSAGGLGTRVNGTALGRCTGGICSVQGGTRAGQNQFYRFSQFDTRSKIQRVDLDTRGRRNVVVGVGAPNGSFFGAPIHLSEAANLFWLSPGGIWLGQGAGFVGANNLLLSTSPTMRFGGKEFDVLSATASEALRLDQRPDLDLTRLAEGGGTDGGLGAGTGPIVLAGGRLHVDRNLLIDSGVGPIRSELGGGAMEMAAGGTLQLAGGRLSLANLNLQAGTETKPGLVKLRAGVVAGGAPGSLGLQGGTLRGGEIALQGAGGVQLQQVEARATSGAGKVEIIAGTSSQPATTELQQVSLEADRIDVRATGALVARDLQAFAPLGGGSMTLVSGLEDKPGQAGLLRLDTSTLQAASLVIQAYGPMELEGVTGQAGPKPKPAGSVPLWIATTAGPLQMQDVTLVAPEIGVEAGGDLKATNLRADAQGINGKGGNLWLFSSPPAGQQPISPRSLALKGGRLQADQLVVQVEGGGGNRLEMRNLTATAGSSAGGGSLWLLNGTVDKGAVKPEGPVVVEGVAMKGSELRLEGGQISVSGSTLTAPGAESLIKLQGLGPGEGEGAVGVRGSTLQGQAIVARTNGALALQGVRAQAGTPGNRGVILLESSEEQPGARERAQLRDVDLQAKRIVVRSGAIQVDNSQLQAPKGMVHLEANAGDLEVSHSTLDVGVKTLADLTTPVSQIYKLFGVTIIDPEPEPSIGLFALAGHMRLAQQSQILASQVLQPAWQALPREQIQLTDTSGVVVGDAGKSLSVSDSVIRADASDNLAGNVILRSQGREGEGGLSINRSTITASGGAGSGDLRFSSANGMRIEQSTLMAQSSNSPKDPTTGAANWKDYFFSGGEINLTNQSDRQPIHIVESTLKAEHAASGGLLSPLPFISNFPKFTDEFDSTDSGSSPLSGGRISLISSGGVQITGTHSLLSVDSKTSPDSAIEGFRGKIRLINLGDEPVSVDLENQLSARADFDSPKTPENRVLPSDDPDFPPIRSVDPKQIFYGSLEDYRIKYIDDPGYSFGRYDLLYILTDPRPLEDQVIFGGVQYSNPLPKTILKRKNLLPRDLIFLPSAQSPLIIEKNLPQTEGNLVPPQLNPFVVPFLAPQTIPLASTTAMEMVRSSLLISPTIPPSPSSQNSVSLLVEKSEALSPEPARNTFIAAENASTLRVRKSFGLEGGAHLSSDIVYLQRQLQQASTTRASPSGRSTTREAYQPAILQISTAASPVSGKEQITQVLIPARGEIQGWQSQVEARNLRERIRAFQRALSQEGVLDAAGSGRQLAQLLLAPVMPEIRRQGINALILSVDRNLQGLPFAALPLEGGTLVDQVALTITPSLGLTDLRAERPTTSAQRALLAGTSRFENGLAPLPMAPEELRQVASLHPGAVVLLEDAFQSRSLLAKAQGQHISVLHLATHADFVHQAANGARIFTSHGDFSLADLGRELRRTPGHHIGLFVLNACRTAIGNEERELGIAGLALQAGAESALGNLWFVDDAASAAFSVQFHRLLQQGVGKDQALQQTQKLFRVGAINVQGDQIINQKGEKLVSGLSREDQIRFSKSELSHPYFWAGSILSGSPW